MKIWVDGAGWNGKVSGFAVVFENGKVIEKKFEENKTNNEMEHTTLIEALKHASEGDSIFSDSQLVVKQVKGEYAVKEPRLKPLVDEGKKLIEEKKVTLEWIPREENKAGKLLENKHVKDISKPRMSSYVPGVLCSLENYAGSISLLAEIKTTRRKEVFSVFKDAAIWLNNPHFTPLKDKKLDISIIAFVNKQRMRRQDVDNIAKATLDALKMDTKKPDKPYLFNDDSQIIRLLICKYPKEESEQYAKDTFVVSFREHDPQKQMTLI